MSNSDDALFYVVVAILFWGAIMMVSAVVIGIIMIPFILGAILIGILAVIATPFLILASPFLIRRYGLKLVEDIKSWGKSEWVVMLSVTAGVLVILWVLATLPDERQVSYDWGWEQPSIAHHIVPVIDTDLLLAEGKVWTLLNSEEQQDRPHDIQSLEGLFELSFALGLYIVMIIVGVSGVALVVGILLDPILSFFVWVWKDIVKGSPSYR